MKRILIVLLISSNIYANKQVEFICDEPTKTSSSVNKNINKLIKLSFDRKKLEEMTKIMFDQIPAEVRSQMPQGFNKFIDIIITEFTSDDIKKQFKDMYLEYFNEDDLQALINFYESPTGKKTLAKMPEIGAKTGLITGKIFNKAFSSLQAESQLNN